jgi:branched-chain amino acid transport system substrate-binding protein
MKAKLWGFTGLVLVFFLCSLTLGAYAAKAPSVVKVGLVVPLTGKLAPFGESSKAGVDLAAEFINKAGGVKGLGGAKIKIITMDSGSDPTSAASATLRLLSTEKVAGVIGCYASSLSLAASEVTERNHVPFLTMSTTDILTNRGFKYLFQVVPKASVIGAAQVEQAVAIAKQTGHKIKRIAILHEDTAYGSSTAEGLATAAKRLGVKVVLDDGYPSGITDATPLIEKVKLAKPDIIFPISYYTDAVLIIRSMRQAGLTIPVFGGAAGYVIPEFKKALGKYVNGILTIDYSSYDHYGKWGAAYQKKVGKFMPHEAFENLVCLYALVDAMNQAKTADPAKLGPVLHKIKMTGMPADGIPGGVQFNKAGLNIKAYPITVQWQKGELVSVWPKSYAKGKPYWP